MNKKRKIRKRNWTVHKKDSEKGIGKKTIKSRCKKKISLVKKQLTVYINSKNEIIQKKKHGFEKRTSLTI